MLLIKLHVDGNAWYVNADKIEEICSPAGGVNRGKTVIVCGPCDDPLVVDEKVEGIIGGLLVAGVTVAYPRLDP